MAAVNRGGVIPADYQQVAYLESTGEQVINTGILSSGIGRWVTETQFISIPSIQTYEGTQVNTASRLVIGATSGNWVMGGSSIGLPADTDKHRFELNANGKWKIDELEGDAIIDSPRKEMSLFMRYKNTTYPTRQKKYFNEFYDLQDNLIQKLISCYRKSDHKPGMYDTVTNTFFVNQGTGDDFILGPDV